MPWGQAPGRPTLVLGAPQIAAAVSNNPSTNALTHIGAFREKARAGLCRQQNFKRCSFPRFAHRTNVPVVVLDYLTHDGQAHARTSERSFAMQAREHVEDPRSIFLLKPNPVIHYLNEVELFTMIGYRDV